MIASALHERIEELSGKDLDLKGDSRVYGAQTTTEHVLHTAQRRLSVSQGDVV